MEGWSTRKSKKEKKQAATTTTTTMSVLDWNEAKVNQFFISLGLNRYESAIREHALTGDVLIHLDNELLKDIGIQSVGKRLTILKAIYKLKLKEDIPIEDGHWIPPLGDLEHEDSDPDTHSDASPILTTPPHQTQAVSTPNHQQDSFNQLIQLRDQRINNLESDIRSIKQELQSLSAKFLSLSSTPNSPSLLVEAVTRNCPATIRAKDRHMREESICQLDIHDPASPAQSQTNPTIPPQEDTTKPSQPSSPALSSIIKPTTQEILQTQSCSQDVSSPTKQEILSTSAEATPKPIERSTKSEQSMTAKSNGKDHTGDSTASTKDRTDPSNPYKSFRVTLEDPCYKVLPAALKKYKINEHYKNYVLFICYGKQERCLSYEEKPLLLFQKLKEANQNPVFTLRHIKDIESPVSLALVKQSQRREKKLAESKANTCNTTDSTTTTHSTVSTIGAVARKAPPSSGRVEKATGFCIAIYPYMSEGDEDFDVGVGDTFIIVGKSKGWWVVNRDKGTTTTKIDRTEGAEEAPEKEGWVPSGCLLETKKSFSNGEAGKVTYQTTILPEDIFSASSSCYGLMDYIPKGSDELGFDIKDRLKVYKKYNNWSYAINESKPDKPRGWTPSWLIGTRKEKEAGGGSTGATSPISTKTASSTLTTATAITTSTNPATPTKSSSSSINGSIRMGTLKPSLSSASSASSSTPSSSLSERQKTSQQHTSISSCSSATHSMASDCTTATSSSTTTVTPATSLFTSQHNINPLSSSSSSSFSNPEEDSNHDPHQKNIIPDLDKKTAVRNLIRTRNRNSTIYDGIKELKIPTSSPLVDLANSPAS
ncbi:hypothetical protein Pst134EB_006201 [Puccinia striiformis f. sp. tritici]|nr:hypothetical protein Pst134EB_006201 [Puccinia striiformis f. sp. tritici]